MGLTCILSQSDWGGAKAAFARDPPNGLTGRTVGQVVRTGRDLVKC